MKNNSQRLLHGEVVAVHGRHYVVELPGGETIPCFPRGKKSLIACGDRVEVLRSAPGQGVIEAVDPRRSLLYRSDQYRQKLIAANVTQMVIVLAVVPTFYEELLNRCLIAAEHQGIARPDRAEQVRPRRRECPGHDRRCSATHGSAMRYSRSWPSATCCPLRSHLAGHTSVLVGQSGMGKSTIINALLPDAGAAVSDISLALDSGRHTTTYARLYRIDAQAALIDSPGMQEFGLHAPEHGRPAARLRGIPAPAGSMSLQRLPA